MTKGQYAQWIAAGGIFLAWMYLVVAKVQGADDIIFFIKGGLAAFGVYCWNDQAVNKGINLATTINGGAASGPNAATPFQPPQ
jgi:hypothetical protein